METPISKQNKGLSEHICLRKRQNPILVAVWETGEKQERRQVGDWKTAARVWVERAVVWARMVAVYQTAVLGRIEEVRILL